MAATVATGHAQAYRQGSAAQDLRPSRQLPRPQSIEAAAHMSKHIAAAQMSNHSGSSSAPRSCSGLKPYWQLARPYGISTAALTSNHIDSCKDLKTFRQLLWQASNHTTSYSGLKTTPAAAQTSNNKGSCSEIKPYRQPAQTSLEQ